MYKPHGAFGYSLKLPLDVGRTQRKNQTNKIYVCINLFESGWVVEETSPVGLAVGVHLHYQAVHLINKALSCDYYQCQIFSPQYKYDKLIMSELFPFPCGSKL
jgi:hypothetical protein